VRGRLLPTGLVLFAASAAAHERTTSYSRWDVRGARAHVSVGVAEVDVARFAPAATATLGAYLAERVRLLADGAACPLAEAPRALATPRGRLAYDWAVSCPPGARLAIRSDLFAELAPSHLHFARVTRDGRALPERMLSSGERTWPLTAVDEGTSLAGYGRLGVEHILTGYDHLAFLVALLLVARSVGEVARVVSGFTVAHTLTFGLAAFDWLHPDRAPVEAVIGLSIGLVAAESVWTTSAASRRGPAVVAGALGVLAVVRVLGYGRVPALTLAGLALFVPCYLALVRRVPRPAALRAAVAFLFGLVHGFGFAAALSEAHLAPDRLAQALLGFNGGVEIGQLAVVAVVWPLVRAAAARRPVLIEVGSAAVAGLGTFWFVSRAFG